VAAFFGGRPRFFFTLGSPPSPLSVAGSFGVLGGRPLGRFGGGVSPLSSFFSCKSKTESQHGFGREAKRGVDYSIVLTFGGRPRFLCPAGADEPSAADEDVAFLFLLPLGRPRPRFTGVVGEGSR
jgi:hypothetical protein